MYRVVLKIDKVFLRLREPVVVQVLARKQNWHFMLQGKAILANGQATINSYSQFFISKENPCFSLEVILILGQIKKFAGRCIIDLSKWQINISNRNNTTLEKSPDPKAAFYFDFMYLDSDLKNIGKDLISLEEIQLQSKNQALREMKQKNTYLTNQNFRLTQQLAGLLRQNEQLAEGREQLSKDLKKRQIQFLEQISRKTQQVERSNILLEKQRKRLAQMIDIINSTGQAKLLDKMEDAINERFQQ